jgi:hypothetical protein
LGVASLVVMPRAPFVCRVRATTENGSRDCTLSADEARLAGAVLDEAAHAELLVLGAEQRREMGPLDPEAGVEVEASSRIDCLVAGDSYLKDSANRTRYAVIRPFSIVTS